MELAQYLHASCGSPRATTFIKAINNGNFLTWPGLNASLIKKQLPKSLATAQGHLNQERKNLQSTKAATPATVRFNLKNKNLPTIPVKIKVENEHNTIFPNENEDEDNDFSP